jgi:hypothetical protein
VLVSPRSGAVIGFENARAAQGLSVGSGTVSPQTVEEEDGALCVAQDQMARICNTLTGFATADPEYDC